MENIIKDLQSRLNNKSAILQSMYNCDIIHRSYRNFYGISKIYHLLDTGICDELTGVNGTYSQMRVDMIIDNQKITHQLLNDIKAQNQMMYSAIMQTNRMLDNMTHQIYVQGVNNAQLLRDINSNLEVSNFLQESANNDRRAIAASTEYLAYAEKQRRMSEGHWN